MWFLYILDVRSRIMEFQYSAGYSETQAKQKKINQHSNMELEYIESLKMVIPDIKGDSVLNDFT